MHFQTPVFSRDVRKRIRHARLKVPDYCRLGSRIETLYRAHANGTVLIAVDYIAVVPRRVHSGNPTPSEKDRPALGGVAFSLRAGSERVLSHLLKSSSTSRFTAGAFVFFILSHSGERPERYVEPFRFETVPSRPSLQ